MTSCNFFFPFCHHHFTCITHLLSIYTYILCFLQFHSFLFQINYAPYFRVFYTNCTLRKRLNLKMKPKFLSFSEHYFVEFSPLDLSSYVEIKPP